MVPIEYNVEVMVFGKYEKVYKKIMEDPIHADLTIDEVKTILSRYGFVHKVKGTSHNKFTHSESPYILIIPTKHGRKVPGEYIKMIRQVLIELDV